VHVRATRVIYVENDPALLGIFTTLLEAHAGIEVVCACTSAQAALAHAAVETADVALLDLGLGACSMNGIDLGIALRERNHNLGIVIHSQHEVSHVLPLLPSGDDMAWSYVPKTGDMAVSDIVAVLKSTAAGRSTGTEESEAPDTRSLADLTDRQRAVMALAADGLAAPEIARRLGASHEAVRQELSRAYRVLIPTVGEGEDRRTRAVVAYLRLVRQDSWTES
jgi:two-component system, NarL family, response regulator DesR